jgi:LDH2 family malate/lactate/ureidoglycolate dehydrogenase
LQDLEHFAERTFAASGADERESRIAARVLVAADRFGIETHGIQRLRYYVERVRAGVIVPGAPIKTVRETATTVVVDGGHGFGQVIGTHAMTRAMEKARRAGIGCVAVRDSNHYGIAGYYALLAANEGLVGLTTTNARPCLAPTYGTEPMFGTNPLAFGAPSDEEFPFLYDAAMSIWQRGTLEVRAREGIAIPEGIAIRANAQPATDPSAVLRDLMIGAAAMLPLGGAGTERGGHKGYGLAIVMEILSAAFQGGQFLKGLGGGDDRGEWEHYHTGHFFLVLDPEAFMGAAALRKVVGDLSRQLRESRRADPSIPILTAGQKEWQASCERERRGVELSGALVRELVELAHGLGASAEPLERLATPDGAR